MTEILIFLTGMMAYWVPPPSEADETRYQTIAQDALTVSHERDILGMPDYDQAAVILAVASFESGYSLAMDSGAKRGDGGQSVCLGAIRVLHDKKLRDQIAHDRKECFRRILKRVKYSWDQCAKMKFEDRLSKYIVGRCEPNAYSRMYSERIMDAIAGLHEVFYNEEAIDPDSD